MRKYWGAEPVVSLVIVACLCARAWSQAGVQVRPRAVDTIRPGTVIASQAPAGWTDLIIKSSSRLGGGDYRDVSDDERRIAQLFTTAIVAHVAPASDASRGGPTVIDRVAVGCLTRIGNRDTVVSPDSHKKLGAGLGFFGGMLLGEIYKKQRNVMVVAQSPTLVIIDSPVMVRHKSANRPMVFRYALLLDGRQETLHRLVWLVDPEARRAADRVQSEVEYLSANLVEEFPLYVDRDEYKFGFPTERAFGVMHLPHGDFRIAVPREARPNLGTTTYSVQGFLALEQQLQEMLVPAVAPRAVRAGDILDDRRRRMRQPVLRLEGP